MINDPPPSPRHPVGRPGATSRQEIEDAAFRLFKRHGFEGTTLDDIAREVGVGRRTLFRYYESKNDIAWGQFERSLAEFRALLAVAPADEPMADVLHRAIMDYNTFASEDEAHHRFRMTLIVRTPALRAYSTIRYDEWRRIIEEFVARRTGTSPDDLLPRAVGHVSLAISIAAYEQWLEHPGVSINALLDEVRGAIRQFLG